jgi:hypothetical protein
VWGAGFAESALASYIVSLGRKASSAPALARQLETQARVTLTLNCINLI